MRCTKEYRLRFTEQAQEIVSKLSLEQKVWLMGGNMTGESAGKILEDMMNDPINNHYNFTPYAAGGIEEEQLPPMLFCDGPRGIVCGTGESTCFPVSMLRGATFDTALEEQIGHAIGKEARAQKGNLFAGVCINLPYNPGWGRSQETYGEESFHLGQMGAALVRGVQEEDIMACVKHYAFNQMENARFQVSVVCDKRTEREVFLPHFKDCIDAGAASIMSSYNLYHGVHCGHHNYLLSQVLKREWDFDGFVMSDFIWGVKDTVEAAAHGQDMEMCVTQFFGKRLVKAVEDGFVPEEKINDAALRIVRTILAFNKEHKEYDKSVLACEQHVELARQAAREGITLLQNQHQTLPFCRETTKKIAVIGKLAKEQSTGDHGSSWVFPPYVVTPFDGIQKAAPEATLVYADGSDLQEAKRIAVEADAVVFVVGYDHDDEGEFVAYEGESYTGGIGGDRRESLGLHREDIALLKEVAPGNSNNAVILIGGNMIMMTEWKDQVSAVLMAYYPGMEGGNVLGEILFGDTNPSGKLPYVLPVQEADLPQVDWNATEQYYEYYHGYARLEKKGIKPLLPYGYGLSYTSFALSDAAFGTDGEQVTASCSVRNAGDRAGTEVVQLYIGFQNSAVDRPVKLLRGFGRVTLQPGEEQLVTLSCPVEKLCWYNPLSRKMELEQMEYQVSIGTSSDPKDLLEGWILL